MASINTEVTIFNQKVDLLLSILGGLDHLDYRYQKLLAETIFLRLFYHLEIAVEGIALKLARGIPYCDGVAPTLICPVHRSVAAVEAYIARNRARGSPYLKWTTLAEVVRNLSVVFNQTEHFLVHRTTYDADLENMRHIRNHIGHGTKSTKGKFVLVVTQMYGGPRTGVSPGKLLLSQRAPFVGGNGNQPIVEQYLLWSKTFIRTLAKA